MILGGAAAVIAAVVLIVYLQNYRDSVAAEDEPIAVLVAKSLIPEGTAGDVIGSTELFTTVETPKSQVKEGAITDPAVLGGRTAVADIFPGQQLTAADFTTDTVDALGQKLVGAQRAISIPLDTAHGMIGRIIAGDHIDVLAGFNVATVDEEGKPVEGGAPARPVIKPIMQDILVVAVPGVEDSLPGGGTGHMTLQVTPEESAQLAFASDNGKIWFVLRPRTGAPAVTPNIVTLETLLLGIKPVTIEKTFVEEKEEAQP